MATNHRPKIAATARQAWTKAELSANRRAGRVPGSLYGRAVAPVNVQVSSRAIADYLSAHGTGALLDLDLDGLVSTVIVKEVDRKPITSAVIHVAFQRVGLGDQLRTSIPVHFEGVVELVRRGFILQTQLEMVEINGQADQLPEALSIDISMGNAGDVIHLGSIALPAGVTFTRDDSTAIAIITAPRTVEIVPEAVAAPVAAAAV